MIMHLWRLVTVKYLSNKVLQSLTSTDAIFDSGADAEQFFYRLGLKDGIRLHKIVKSIVKEIS